MSVASNSKHLCVKHSKGKKHPKLADSANEIDKRQGQCCDNDTERLTAKFKHNLFFG